MILKNVTKVGIPLLFTFSTMNAYSAVPAEGSIIGNQATANYTDGSGENKIATSNLVETIVAKISGVEITSDQNKTITVGGTALFQHTIRNTGNGTDSFDLSFSDLNNGSLNFNSIEIYADADQNGVPDSATPITQTPPLDANESYGVIISAVSASNAVDGDFDNITITATSDYDNLISNTNTNTISITGNAVVEVSKKLSVSSGESPSTAPITVTLTYTNNGNNTAEDITIVDSLPNGMTYVPNSGVWSGLAGFRSDASDLDEGGIDYSIDNNEMTAVITSLSPSSSGTLTFQVTIDSNLPPSDIINFANVTYDDGSGTIIGPVNTNDAIYKVIQTSNVEINDKNSTYDEDGSENNIVQINTPVAQGATVSFDNTIINNGNGNDTFELSVINGTNTFPNGTVFQFFKADGATPLSDTNSDGNIDTGVINFGDEIKVVVKAILPSTAHGNSGFEFDVEATSKFDNSKSDTVKNILSTILKSTVDLTNDTSVNSGANSSDGLGEGIEASPVRSISINPSETGTYSLIVNNTSTIADSYNLEASTDPTFASITIPNDWIVRFKDNTTEVNSTGIISANGDKTFTVEVIIPSDSTPITQPIYLRAISTLTNAEDKIYEEVIVNTIHDISINPNNTGQIFPNGTTVYAHSIKNNGNVSESAGSINVTQSSSGWNAIIYHDINENGILDATDTTITNISDIGTLNPNDSVTILVKVFAPASSGEGSVNTTTVIVSGIIGETILGDNIADDVSTVITGDISLSKRHGIDTNCDGTPDSGFTTVQLTDANPAECIVYEVTATNSGSAVVNDLEINDTTPNFTTYFDCAGSCSASSDQGTPVTPSNGATGNIVVNAGSLSPSASVVLTFVVQIDQ